MRRQLQHAFDEIRFGPGRTLNLRAALPTVAQAKTRTDAWLRERQAHGAHEVLIITGRGNQSADGVSVVRDAVARLLSFLKRRGVVSEIVEHTPGSFVVRLAPLSALSAAPRRRKDPMPTTKGDPQSLAALSPETRTLLRRVAVRALETLGVTDPEPFVEDEMVSQFGHIAAGIPEQPNREERLRFTLKALLAEYEDQ